MANKIVNELIDELSDNQIDTLLELQEGRPESMVNDNTVESLDERDLVNRIQYTSTRSKISVPGWALSERGNQVAEEVRRREQSHKFNPALNTPQTKKATPPKKTAASKPEKNLKKKNSDAS